MDLAGRQVAVENRAMADGAHPIRPVRPDELGAIRDIEVGTGVLFADIGMSFIADEEPPPVELLEQYRRAGRAWVSTDPTDRPVAFLIADLVDDCAHVEQVSVDPSFGRRGIGRSLIDHLEAWATGRGLRAVTLTTFRDVPWNGPYYARCGFVTLQEADMGPELAARLAAERQRHLGGPRVAMGRDL